MELGRMRIHPLKNWSKRPYKCQNEAKCFHPFKMAAAPQPSGGHKLSLEIRTKSVEQTLIPLVTQVCAYHLCYCASSGKSCVHEGSRSGIVGKNVHRCPKLRRLKWCRKLKWEHHMSNLQTVWIFFSSKLYTSWELIKAYKK